MNNTRILVYGGRGALGSACINTFKAKGFWVCSVDFQENAQADCNVTINSTESLISQHDDVKSKISHAAQDAKFNAIFCVAGGWAGGNSSHKDFIKNVDMMWKQSVWSSSIASSLASHSLSADGLLVFIGADAALQATPNMLGYGMAKAAVHQLVKSLAAKGSGLPENVCVTAILPSILDTPMNRKWMKNADTSSWTPLTTVADKFVDWILGNDRPKSGNLIRLVTKNGSTEFLTV